MIKISDLKVGDKVYYIMYFNGMTFNMIKNEEPDEITSINYNYNRRGWKNDVSFIDDEIYEYDVEMQEESPNLFRTKEELIKAYIEFLEGTIKWSEDQLQLAKEWKNEDN